MNERELLILARRKEQAYAVQETKLQLEKSAIDIDVARKEQTERDNRSHHVQTARQEVRHEQEQAKQEKILQEAAAVKQAQRVPQEQQELQMKLQKTQQEKAVLQQQLLQQALQQELQPELARRNGENAAKETAEANAKLQLQPKPEVQTQANQQQKEQELLKRQELQAEAQKRAEAEAQAAKDNSKDQAKTQTDSDTDAKKNQLKLQLQQHLKKQMQEELLKKVELKPESTLDSRKKSEEEKLLEKQKNIALKKSQEQHNTPKVEQKKAIEINPADGRSKDEELKAFNTRALAASMREKGLTIKGVTGCFDCDRSLKIYCECACGKGASGGGDDAPTKGDSSIGQYIPIQIDEDLSGYDNAPALKWGAPQFKTEKTSLSDAEKLELLALVKDTFNLFMRDLELRGLHTKDFDGNRFSYSARINAQGKLIIELYMPSEGDRNRLMNLFKKAICDKFGPEIENNIVFDVQPTAPKPFASAYKFIDNLFKNFMKHFVKNGGLDRGEFQCKAIELDNHTYDNNPNKINIGFSIPSYLHPVHHEAFIQAFIIYIKKEMLAEFGPEAVEKLNFIALKSPGSQAQATQEHQADMSSSSSQSIEESAQKFRTPFDSLSSMKLVPQGFE